MTAEIAIITRQAVVLAADSAVTIGKQRVWKTANKLFSLGPKHDIAIMVYGSGEFLTMPWEVAVKEFRRKSAATEFKTVAACADAFKAFLSSDVFANEDRQRNSILFPMFDFLSAIGQAVGKGGKKQDAVRVLLLSARKNVQDRGKLSATVQPPPDEVINRFLPSIKRFASRTLSDPIANALEDEIRGLLVDFLCCKFESEYASGVVVAGFGSDEFFPALRHYIADGRTADHLRWWEGPNCKDLNDPKEDEDYPIIPFAQNDMSFQFMAGISEGYLQFIDNSLASLIAGASDELIDQFVPGPEQENARKSATSLSDQLAKTFMEKMLGKVRDEQYAPINLAVTALPKEEMALMAEALVDITSLKRKVDSQLETVGGPVDVAVISKGDGLIWYKRKHYFDPTLNHDYFRRKQAENGEGA